MGGIDFSVVGLFIAVVAGLASFVISRRMRDKRAARRRERDRKAAQINETRQVRRARERRGG